MDEVTESADDKSSAVALAHEIGLSAEEFTTHGDAIVKAFARRRIASNTEARLAAIEECAAYHDKEAQYCFERQAESAEIAPSASHNYFNRGNDHLDHAKAIRALAKATP